MRTKLTVTVLAWIIALIFPAAVAAVTVPSFPSCTNPSGTLKVHYDEGKHGIPGSTATYDGMDTVYRVDSMTQLLQCFCPDNGTGVQTAWWKAGSLSPDDIEILKKDDWIYIPDGSLWGLDPDPYMAKNSTITCNNGGGGTGGNGSSGGGGGNSNTSGGSTNGSSDTRIGSPRLGEAGGVGGGDILGLATTGDSALLSVIAVFSILGILLSFGLLRQTRKE